jgi:uncharacterized protein (TIGR02246 family)
MVDLRRFAQNYTAAWNSNNPEAVASFFATDGSLKVNGGAAAEGRAAIAAVARGFMTDIPDLDLSFDGLEEQAEGIAYHWTLRGTYAATGAPVSISGFELWTLADGPLIVQSFGKFDAEEYSRQIAPPGD